MADSDVVLWHNPRCSKSRQALELLRSHGVEARVVPYLDEPPSAGEIERVLALLGIEPRDLMRKKEDAYADLGLDDPTRTRAELIAAMIERPILIERPVAIRGDRAVLGRPPEKVLELLPPR